MQLKTADFFRTVKLKAKSANTSKLQRKGNKVPELAIIKRAKVLGQRGP